MSRAYYLSRVCKLGVRMILGGALGRNAQKLCFTKSSYETG